MSETSRWLAVQSSRELQEYTNELRGMWADEAGHTVYRRYLNPHYSDDENMHTNYSSQDLALRNAEQKCEQAREQRLQAEEASIAIASNLRYTYEEMQNADYHRVRSIDEEKQALWHIQQTEHFMGQANQIGLM